MQSSFTYSYRQTYRQTYKPPAHALTLTFLTLATLFAAACQDATESTPSVATDPSQSAAVSATPAETRSNPDHPVATTQHGPVRGFVQEGILTFKGVRYGADTASTRFAAPAHPEPWSEPIDAHQFGASAPQAQRGFISLFTSWANEPDPGNSEDCLFLNVWTPALDQRKRPVMVWFHGGGFTSGSGSANAYDGNRLASRGDVVIVTVNHRLNLFGYTYLDEYGETFAGSANAGMLDLVASLEWVRDNIENFGGDPDNVLIFGESGGGWKVSTLMAMQAASGLFHRAVVQSGPGLELMEQAVAAEATRALVAQLGLNEETIEQIRTLPPAELQAAAEAVAAAGGPRVGNRPVVDGIHNLAHPFSPQAPALSRDIPLLIGSTQTEMSLLAGAARPELFELTWDTLPAALTATLPGIDADAVIKGYRELHPDIDAPNLYFEATTDNSVFGRGSFQLADRKAAQNAAPVYQYYMTWRSPVEGGKWGATHALDIGFVFDNVALSESMSGTGETQQALADVMSEAWLAFARTGDPNHTGLPEWPTYNSTTRATMIFDDQPVVMNDPRGEERAILDAAL